MAASLPSELHPLVRNLKLVVFDFDGVFTDNKVYVFEDGREAVACSRSEGFGLERLRKTGVELLVLSTEVNPVVTARCRKLQLDCVQGQRDKRAALEQILAERNVPPGQVAYVGNDVNDRGCLELVGLPMVVHDAHPDVHPLARYRTARCGGDGAVRELCDLLAAVREASV